MLKLIALFTAIALLSACRDKPQEHTLTGRWGFTIEGNRKVVAVFKKDNTHEFFIDDKLFTSGKSIFRNDTLKAFDPICSGAKEYYCTYHIDFISADSILFTAIEDSCEPRRKDMDGRGLKRIE